MNVYDKLLNVYDKLLDRVLEPLLYDTSGDIFRLLFLLSFDELKKAEIGNPLEHHLIVLEHMIEISEKENINLLNAGAISILHDIGPVEKIRKADVEAKESQGEKEVLELKRRQNRTLHMREGSALAQKKLLLLNDYLRKVFYTDEDIEDVCEVIRIHDNPSLDIPIPRENKMAVAFREADRLWMLSDEGFKCDLYRDMKEIKTKPDIAELSKKRLKHVIERFQDERNIYSNEDGPFIDDKLFFRTKTGYEIHKRYFKEREEKYEIQ